MEYLPLKFWIANVCSGRWIGNLRHGRYTEDQVYVYVRQTWNAELLTLTWYWDWQSMMWAGRFSAVELDFWGDHGDRLTSSIDGEVWRHWTPEAGHFLYGEW